MTITSSSNLSGPNNGRGYPTSSPVDYPLRFLNMLHFQRPKTLAEIFKWCIILEENYGILSQITDKMARYPITRVQVTGDIGENESFYSDLLNDELDIQSELVSNGKDYYTFGNCIVSIVPPFKRYLVCKHCDSYLRHCINDENMEEKKFEWKFYEYKFIGTCLNCKKQGVMQVKDEYLKGEDFARNTKIHRWPITHIKVRDLSIAGKKKIYYRLEEKYRKPINNGDRFVVANVPETFILACKKNGATPIIELPSELTYHYKYEGITEPEWEGLSKPFFFSVWKDVFMSFVLRKAQECIASDHLIPNRFIFPTSGPDGRDPLSKIDGANWLTTVTAQLKRQQNDPNEIGVVPFPLGYQAIGGQGKAMSLKEDIDLNDRRILLQMGIPPELIYGGMSWSGGNVALRMLENVFLYYTNKQNSFLMFFVKYIARNSGKKAPTKVMMMPFKMADDIQQMNAMSALGATGRVSETTSLAPFGNGINLAKEAEQMEQDAKNMERIVTARQKVNALANAAVSKEMNLQQIDTSIEGQIHQNDASISANSNLVDGFVGTTPQGVVNKLKGMPLAERQATLRELQAKSPEQFNIVMGMLNGTAAQPLPEQKPPKDGRA